MKKLISNIFSCVVILLALVLLAVGIVPRLAGYEGYYVATDSMTPAIKVGSLVFVKEVEFEDVKVGDVLTFTKEGSEKWFTHRVIGVNEYTKAFRTKGDNNNIEDPAETPYKAVVGRVEWHVPIVGYLSMALDATWGKIVFFAICVLYAAIEVENIASKNRKKKEGLSE